MTKSRTRILTTSFRHDIHKLTGDSHEHAADTFAGVPVNRPVPYGADGDAAALSRPSGQPKQTVPTHTTHARLSLVTGESQADADTRSMPRLDTDVAMRRLVCQDDPEALHRAWLDSELASTVNESVYYPYTSLKYHTLLVAALCDNYYDGHWFADLRLVVDPPTVIVPHRTIYVGDRCALRLDADPDGRPAGHLGRCPRRSWAATWGQLPTHPLDVAHDTYDRGLDANLRRIRAWSTALQYLEDVETRGVAPENVSWRTQS